MNFRPLMGNFEDGNSLVLGSVFLYWFCFLFTVVTECIFVTLDIHLTTWCSKNFCFVDFWYGTRRDMTERDRWMDRRTNKHRDRQTFLRKYYFRQPRGRITSDANLRQLQLRTSLNIIKCETPCYFFLIIQNEVFFLVSKS